MGYHKTPKTIARVKPLLDQMVESSISIEWVFKDPKKVAYKMWEAIRYAIKSRKDEFEQYSTLLNKYKIRVIDPDIVRAEIRETPVISPDGTIIRDVNDVLGVIGAAIELKAKKLIFPEVELNSDESDLQILETWCSNNSYTCRLDDHNRVELTRDE